MTRETVTRTIESVEYDFIRSNAQMETIELLAKTLIEVRKHMTAHIPERVFDMVDDAIEKSGFKK